MSEPRNKTFEQSSAPDGRVESSGPHSRSELSEQPATSPPHGSSTGATPAEGLKLVTLAPSGSLPDVEEPGSQPQLRRDPYLGCVVDQRYKVEKVLGEGGMGKVYQCRHTVIGKQVAMKVLRADLARDSEVTERFLNEAKAASAIGNPHIIDISDFGRLPDGSTYFVMEYLDGLPLSSAFSEGQPTPIPRLINIARQLAEGLSDAHAANIVHRDLKPDNIFLLNRGKEKDFVKILDFGIAKVSSAEQGKLTRAGTVFGTPHYMSPEQAAGSPVDHRCDIYSMGVILYEMASGKVPFDADNFMGILTQHMYKSPVPIRALIPQPQDVPPGLEAIILKCLSKRPEQRYQSMDELIEELDRLRAGLVPQAVPELMSRSANFNVPADYLAKAEMPAPLPASPVSSRQRSRLLLYVGIAIGCGALALALFLSLGQQSSEVATKEPEPTAVAPAAQAAPAEPAAASPKQAAPAPTVEPVEREVVVRVEPKDARVFLGDEDLGESPVVVKVQEGQRLALRAERHGYVAGSLEVDGTDQSPLLKLERAKGQRPAGRPATSKTNEPAPATTSTSSTKKKTVIGGSEIINPWD